MITQLPLPGKAKSLYQRCMDLIATLYSFPLFEYYLFPDGVDKYLVSSSDNLYIADPVEVLWNCFKLGAPLCVIYNELAAVTNGVYLQPSDVSNVEPPFYPTMPCKDNLYKAIAICKEDPNLQALANISVSELYKDDTAGFMKVLKLVEELIILIKRNNNLPTARPLPFSTDVVFKTTSPYQANVTRLLKELIETERAYIFSLEELQRYQAELVASKTFSNDMIRLLFSNLNELVDFQRRFLVGLESTIRLDPENQRIGALFILNEEAFEVYFPFCTNFQSAQNFAAMQTEELQNLSHIIPPHQLQLYLIKPIQRLLNYPLILKELVQTDLDSYPHKHELEEGLESIKRVVGHLNELQRKSENERIFSELVESMEDWLGLRPSEFGELLLSDQVLLVSDDQERSYELFLFEKLLLCCKKNKKDVRGKLQQSGTFGYILRGNIYVRSMLRVENTSDPIFGDYSLKVYWKDASEPDLVCFRCKYRNEGQAALWADRLQTQIYKYRDRTETQPIEPVIQEPGGILTYMTNEVFEYIPEDNLVKQSEATTFNHPEHLHETKPLRRPIPPRGSSRSRNNNILRPGSNFDADNDRSSINTLESVEIAMRIGAVGLREATRQYSHSYPFDAMISLASSDRTLGQELYDLLSSNGFKVWVYWVNMSGNMDRSMMEGITRSALFIPILSDDYYGRMDCMFELQAASSQCKRSLVLKKPGVLPANVLAHLGRLQYIEVNGELDGHTRDRILGVMRDSVPEL